MNPARRFREASSSRLVFDRLSDSIAMSSAFSLPNSYSESLCTTRQSAGGLP